MLDRRIIDGSAKVLPVDLLVGDIDRSLPRLVGSDLGNPDLRCIPGLQFTFASPHGEVATAGESDHEKSEPRTRIDECGRDDLRPAITIWP
jgi:hypothetical protein